MKFKIILWMLVIVITVLGASCSGNTGNTSKAGTVNDKVTPATVSNEAGKDTAIAENPAVNDAAFLSVTYIGYEEHYRFISKSSAILWMPDENGPKVCDLSNTLVEVMFAGYTTEDCTWLFVSFRTYDTPSNNRGWIRESNTEKYTKENQKLVKDIMIPKGTRRADRNEENAENYDRFGLIEKQEEDKVLVMFAGGDEGWYYKKDIKYPPVD